MDEKNKPFNDVIDHFNKIEGNAPSPTNTKLRKLPKPIKLFGYFIIAFFSLSFVFLIILNLLK